MKKTLKVLFLIVCVGGVALLSIAIYVVQRGVPEPVVRRYLEQFEREQGVRVAVAHIRWTPWHEVVARDVRVTVPGTGIRAAFRKVVVNLGDDVHADVPERSVRIRLSSGQVDVASPDVVPSSSILIAGADIVIDPDRKARIHLRGTVVDGWRLNVNGSFTPSPEPPAVEPVSTLAQRLVDLGPRIGTILNAAVTHIEKGWAPGMLDADIRFEIDAAHPDRNRVWASVEGASVRFGELRFAPCSAVVEWTDGLLLVKNLNLRTPDSTMRLDARGTVNPVSWEVDVALRVRAAPEAVLAAGIVPTNLADRVLLVGRVDAHLDLGGNLREPAQMRIDFQAAGADAPTPDRPMRLEQVHGTYSNGILRIPRLSVTAENPESWLPERFLAAIERAGVGLPAPLRADLELGPAPPVGIATNIAGRISSATVRYRDATFADLSIDFARQGEEVRLTAASACLADDGPRRTVTGQGVLRLGGGYQFQLRTDAEPRRMAACLPTNIVPLALSCDVGGYSHVEATFTRDAGEPSHGVIEVVLHAADVTRNEAPMDLIHAALTYSNATLHVRDLTLARQDSRLTGRLGYDFATGLLSVQAVSSLAPLSLSRFIDPKLERLLAVYRMEGPVGISAEGTIGLRNNPTRDLRLHIKGEQLGWRWFLADRAEFNLSLIGEGVILEELRAQWCGGEVTGAVRFDRQAETNIPGRCGLDFQVQGAALAKVVDLYRDLENPSAHEGTLSGTVTLSGEAGPAFLQTATGSGDVNIQDGYILSLPLFGGLSKYLSVLIPGLGYASQRDLRASFRVEDGRVASDDAQLLGQFVSIRGKGSYAFTNDLNVRVQVQFLKEGLTATVVRFISSPLTKALEFELTGTTQDPRWRPVNTPDRLLRFFMETIGGLMPSKD